MEPVTVRFTNTETLLPPESATTRSGLPSLFKSATVMEYGVLPVKRKVARQT